MNPNNNSTIAFGNVPTNREREKEREGSVGSD
jgi:hypothetical protein